MIIRTGIGITKLQRSIRSTDELALDTRTPTHADAARHLRLRGDGIAFNGGAAQTRNIDDARKQYAHAIHNYMRVQD